MYATSTREHNIKLVSVSNFFHVCTLLNNSTMHTHIHISIKSHLITKMDSDFSLYFPGKHVDNVTYTNLLTKLSDGGVQHDRSNPPGDWIKNNVIKSSCLFKAFIKQQSKQ